MHTVIHRKGQKSAPLKSLLYTLINRGKKYITVGYTRAAMYHIDLDKEGRKHIIGHGSWACKRIDGQVKRKNQVSIEWRYMPISGLFGIYRYESKDYKEEVRLLHCLHPGEFVRIDLSEIFTSKLNIGPSFAGKYPAPCHIVYFIDLHN
jgi:hypothetical protein